MGAGALSLSLSLSLFLSCSLVLVSVIYPDTLFYYCSILAVSETLLFLLVKNACFNISIGTASPALF